jgi:hypothetical protein
LVSQRGRTLITNSLDGRSRRLGVTDMAYLIEEQPPSGWAALVGITS